MAKIELTPAQQEDTIIVAGSVSPGLAIGAAGVVGIDPAGIKLKQFPSGEVHAQFLESVRRRDVFIIQSHCANPEIGFSVNDALQEHLVMVDAARRASASHITAIMPFFGYSRQDRKAEGREPISAKLVANQFKAAGADHLIAFDLHAPQIQGFFDPVFDNLTAMRALRKEVETQIPKRKKSEWAVVAPDNGRNKTAKRWAKELEADYIVIDKDRGSDGRISTEGRRQFAALRGVNCVVVDDMVDTAGTLVNSLDIMRESGAQKIVVAATHPIFSGRAIKNIDESAVDLVVTTNSVPTQKAQRKLGDKVRVIDIAPIIGSAIGRIVTKGSLSDMFDGEDRS